ncbi:MAG: hypothetical protein HQL06_01125 [Nitrospirae bacterium]|nr:hypothetical protein [Nitrospirota bacterium]
MDKPKKNDPHPALAAFEAFNKVFKEFEETKVERIKCWEYFNCERAKNGCCSAYTKSAGRRCWLVAGTLSGGEPDCPRAKALKSCKECEFYKKIKRGEF